PGSAPSLVAAALAEALPERLWVVVAPDPVRAEAVEADLQTLLSGGLVRRYPQREALPYEAEDAHLEVSGLRVEALEALLAGRVRVLVTTSRALQERADIPTGLAELRLSISVGDTFRLQELTERLDSLGFTRSSLVEGVGGYAVRGGILDLFSFGAAEPVRIEFWGDEVFSIRRFDILDQRSTDDVRHVDVLPVNLGNVAEGASVRRSVLDVLPRDAILF